PNGRDLPDQTSRPPWQMADVERLPLPRLSRRSTASCDRKGCWPAGSHGCRGCRASSALRRQELSSSLCLAGFGSSSLLHLQAEPEYPALSASCCRKTV